MAGPYWWINLGEAVFWIALAVVVVAVMVRRRRVGAWSLALAIVLVMFGISDVVENHTGAWWRPWWLLVWKTVCVAALAALGVAAYRRRAAYRAGASSAGGAGSSS